MTDNHPWQERINARLDDLARPLDDDSNYTDRATLDADIRWVLRGSSIKVAGR